MCHDLILHTHMHTYMHAHMLCVQPSAVIIVEAVETSKLVVWAICVGAKRDHS